MTVQRSVPLALDSTCDEDKVEIMSLKITAATLNLRAVCEGSERNFDLSVIILSTIQLQERICTLPQITKRCTQLNSEII